MTSAPLLRDAGSSVQLAQRLSKTNSLQYRFSFRRSEVSDVKISPELVPLLSQPVRVGLLSMSYIYDRRDNSTDTHRGILNTVDAGISLAAFSSQTDFTRVIFRNSTYHPIGKEIVLARTLQLGSINRIGGLQDIPLAERLFAGGSSSPARVSRQSGRSARSGNRLPAGRNRDSIPLHGIAFSLVRRKCRRRFVSRHGERLFGFWLDQSPFPPARHVGL